MALYIGQYYIESLSCRLFDSSLPHLDLCRLQAVAFYIFARVLNRLRIDIEPENAMGS